MRQKCYVISQYGSDENFKVVDVKLSYAAARAVAKESGGRKIEKFMADKKPFSTTGRTQ